MPFVLSVGKKLKAQEHTTFCWFPLSLNNPFVDRGNGHWNFHSGLADYVFELILCLSCTSFSFSLQSLMSIKTWLLPFRKNFETILICLLSDQRKFCHIHSKCHWHNSPPVADFSPVFCTKCDFISEECFNCTIADTFQLHTSSLRGGQSLACSVAWLSTETNDVWRCLLLRKSHIMLPFMLCGSVLTRWLQQWPHYWKSQLHNTEHSCSRYSVVAAWLLSDRPNRVIPLSTTFPMFWEDS